MIYTIIYFSDNYCRHEVVFDDGDVRNIPEKNIIVKEWLSKGQSVLVTKEDGYSYPGRQSWECSFWLIRK